MDAGFAELVKIGGLPFAMLCVALISGSRRVWVFGWQYSEMKAERDDLIGVNRRLLTSLRRAIERGYAEERDLDGVDNDEEDKDDSALPRKRRR